VAEESHLDEMRSAIRGDFARLAERRGDQDLMRVADEPGAELRYDAGIAESEAEEAEKRRSWFARLVSH
jgi:hypothetical protein